MHLLRYCGLVTELRVNLRMSPCARHRSEVRAGVRAEGHQEGPQDPRAGLVAGAQGVGVVEVEEDPHPHSQSLWSRASESYRAFGGPWVHSATAKRCACSLR